VKKNSGARVLSTSAGTAELTPAPTVGAASTSFYLAATQGSAAQRCIPEQQLQQSEEEYSPC
jgi:hypothetical protein